MKWIPTIPDNPLILVAFIMLTLVSLTYRQPGPPRIIELHNVYVIKDVGRYNYFMQSEEGFKFFTTFCADYEPQFSAKQTLLVLKYEDHGECWSVANTHPAYLILRDDNGIPILKTRNGDLQ